MKINFTVLIYLILIGNLSSQEITKGDLIRISEVYHFKEKLKTKLDTQWQGWGETKFAILLVTPDKEYLIDHPSPSNDFLKYTGVINDLVLNNKKIYYRKRIFPVNLLATFPAVNGIPTIVIGQPENTKVKRSAEWVLTLFHEHFHQYQMSNPGYFKSVEELGISGGDNTGMWMINYKFPYSSDEVIKRFNNLRDKLHTALITINDREFNRNVYDYLNARREFKNILSADDYKYFSFQIWQEGIAKYTEYKTALTASESYTPAAEYVKLEDYKTYNETADSIFYNIKNELRNLSLKDYQRIAFYYIGAAEGIILDKFNPEWRRSYFKEKFYTENYFVR